MKRFSDEELFDLRNNVPINGLIEQLQIPSKMSEGYFRFLCPLCNEFQTSTNPKTNLARCFRCQININTIEMVMTYLKYNFVESVKYLKAHRKIIAGLSENRSDKAKVRTGKPLSMRDIFSKISKDLNI